MKQLFYLLLCCVLIFLTCERNEAPFTPKIINQPSSGYIGHFNNIIVSTEDPNNDSVSYQFDWGDGTHSNWSIFSASGLSFASIAMWQNPGDYLIKVRAKDINEAFSDWSSYYPITIYDTLNNPPNIPTILSGPDNGYINTSYNFTASTTDIEGDDIAYQFDWGDGNQSSWSNFEASGTQITMSYSWQVTRTFSVMARARDINGAISDWSNPHTIVIDTSPSGFPNRAIATIPVGNGPIEITALPNGNYLYVANRYSDNVSVIRTSDNTLVTSVPVGSDPYGAVALPNGNYVYISNRYSYDVSVIRTSDNTVVATIPVGEWPIYLAVSPNGNYIYTANWGTDNVSVIRTLDNTVVATIPVNDGPGGACVLPNGNYAYVSNMGSNNVSVIRTSDKTVVATVPTGTYPQGVAALPNGEYVYSANKLGNSVTVIRTSDNSVVATIPVSDGPSRICVLPNGNYLYVSQEYSNTIKVIRTSDNSVVATIPVGQMPAGIEHLPNGNFVYVSIFNEDCVKVIGY